MYFNFRHDRLFANFLLIYVTFKNCQICNLMHGLRKINHRLFSVKTSVTFSMPKIAKYNVLLEQLQFCTYFVRVISYKNSRNDIPKQSHFVVAYCNTNTILDTFP